MNDELVLATFGARLHAARFRAQLTLTQLAERADVSSSSLSRWEADKGLPDVAQGQRLAEALGVELSWLIGSP